MANAGVIDPSAATDLNCRINASSNSTAPATLDHPSFFDDLGFDDEDGNFEFNLDDLSLPSDTEPFNFDDFDFMDETKEMCLVVGDRIDFGIGTVMDSNSTVSVDCVDFNACDNSGNEFVDFDEFKNVVDVSVGGEDLEKCEVLFGKGLSNDDSPSSVGIRPASSHGSGTCVVGFEGVNYSSPEAVSNCDKDLWGNFGDFEMVNEKDVLGKRGFLKRNKESEEGKIEQRSNKIRRSSERRDKCISLGKEDDEKRMARMMRNRESAQLSRQRKKQYVDELEEKIRVMHSTIVDLNHRISFAIAENTCLRQQLGGGSGMYPPPPGMYPHMPYPWMPYPPYAVQPTGSQVPLVPIPRLKSRQPSKSKSSSTKKVASISLLGLFVFIFLFGALVPLMNLRYDGTGPHIHNHHKDRVLTTKGHRDGSELMIAPASLSVHGNHPHNERSRVNEKKNSSEPLLVSLYVPRNDKLLKIDGNLIIHSFLASEKAMSSYMTAENVNDENTGNTAIVSHSSTALTFSEARSEKDKIPTERQRALGPGTGNNSPKHGKPTLGEGRLNQWFHEGLAGPMLNSGMCTEVLQFDISPMSNPGGIIPASSVANSSSDSKYNATHIKQRKYRRALNSLPIPEDNSTTNYTEEYLGKESPRDLLRENKTSSSMVVSILADPRDVDLDSLIEPRTFSRIFVVVLLDSVKYVTYSCMLPIRGLSS